jgi:MFS family permease
VTKDARDQARWYFASVSGFMVPLGIQSVLLSYLLAITLKQPAERFGITQMLGQLPMLLLLLVGGWLADRVDPRRLLIGLHSAGIVMPLLLAIVLWQGQVSEAVVLLYALVWGVISAFAMPARDGLLNRVAGGQVQRMVTITMGIQFGMQMLGQAFAGQAERWGPVGILLVQCAVLALGAYAASRLPAQRTADLANRAARGPILRELGEGLQVLFSDPPIRATFLLLCGMGLFFAGVFVVLIPLAVRDLYAGGASDIAIAMIAFGMGTLTSIVVLVRRGGVRMPGRALCVSQFAGCAALAPIGLAAPVWVFYLCIFAWGMCGGVAMSMSRTIMQELAPATHRSRVMAAFSIATGGGSPLGSLLMGYAISALGVRWSVLVPIIGVTLTTASVMATHSLWRLRSRSH